jgi:thiol:disulfide interchange protein DsbD
LYAQQPRAANAEIVVDSYSLENSHLVPIGILIDLEKNWHIYWRNPGDSGMPTSIDFELPNGVSISEIQWPVPKVFEFDGLASFGYEKQVLLIAELNIPENFESNSVLITANVKSLICKDVCIPFNTTVSKEIKLVNSFSAEDEIAKLFTQAKKSLPGVKNDFELSVVPDENNITFTIKNLNYDFAEINSLYFLPYENGIFKNTSVQNFKSKDDEIELIVEYDQFKSAKLRGLFGILVFQFNDAAQSQKVYEIKKQINTNN